MVRNVYAGDNDQARDDSLESCRRMVFVVDVDASPDALDRVAAIIALANCSPVSGSIVAKEDDRPIISIELHDCAVCQRRSTYAASLNSLPVLLQPVLSGVDLLS